MVIPSETNTLTNDKQSHHSVVKRRNWSQINRVGVTLHKFQEWIRVSSNDRQEKTGEEVPAKHEYY